MWLLVRFLVAVAVGYARSRLAAMRSGGTALTVDGTRMELVRVRSKQHVTACTLLVDVPWRLQVVFRRETGRDRLLKGLGLVREFQHGQPDFDATVFVECDDEELARVLMAQPVVVEAIVRSLRRGATAVFCANGQLGVRWPSASEPE